MKVREAQRVQQIDTIKSVARRLLSESGPEGLVLRKIAREMNQTSSALYRYFANRDELLTALIIDAYNDVGECVEASAATAVHLTPKDQFVAVSHSIRKWAIENPHLYGLIFGTPIPGYVAPPDTIAAAGRVVAVLAGIITAVPTPDLIQRDGDFRPADLSPGVALFLPEYSPATQGRALVMWSSLFGLISFELFGHFVGSVQRSEKFFEASIRELWASLVVTT
jgi:AcrR family transcriptional regulator